MPSLWTKGLIHDTTNSTFNLRSLAIRPSYSNFKQVTGVEKMKTAREALEWIKSATEEPMGGVMIPPMIAFLVAHFEQGKGIDDILEMESRK